MSSHCCSGKNRKYYILSTCVCNLTHPASKAHAPYCHLWSGRLYNIFPHHVINGMIFGKKKVCFDFSLQFSTETFFILRINERDIIKIYRVSQEECARLREGVPYVKVYRYNPKHLSPKLNGYGDNGQRSLKL